MKIKAFLPALAAIALGVAGCSVPSGWSVDGAIDGADSGTRLALEKYSNGRWLLVDSLTVNGNGAFGYDAEQPAAYPELMRLTWPGHGSVFFPVDSIDDVIIEGNATEFSRAGVSGTAAADAFRRVDSIVAAAMASGATAATLDIDAKRQLINEITADTTGIVAYYTATKSLGDRLIFDPADRFGNRVYGAAAQVFATYCPDDPRGQALRQAFFEGRRALGLTPDAPATVVEVPETGLIDIVRFDRTGREQSLREMASHGKVVVLSFTTYEHRQSPAYNAVLNDAYTRYHDQGLEIYQIAFDGSESAWKEVARNLPWTAVWNSPTDGSAVLAAYNVDGLPLTYVIDRQGNIAARIDNPDDIAAAVARYF